MPNRSKTACNACHRARGRRGAALLLSLLIGLGTLGDTVWGQLRETNLAPQSPQPVPQELPASEQAQEPAAKLADSPAGETSGERPVVVNAHLVSLTVTVTDKHGRCVSGLQQEAFTILDEKVRQEISFFSDEDAPVSVGIVIDVSKSMSGDKIRNAREALSRFIRTSHEEDEYFLIAFESKARLLLEKSRDGRAVLDRLTLMKTGGRTALYDAVSLGLFKVKTGAHRKRALLVISDGLDTKSQYSFRDLQRFLQESDAVVYSIGILDAYPLHHLFQFPDRAEGEAVLREISGVAGGKAFFPSTPAEMDEAFERIALELRSQYSIGYRPSNFKNDGSWRRIGVKVTPPPGQPRPSVRTRQGYFARTDPR